MTTPYQQILQATVQKAIELNDKNSIEKILLSEPSLEVKRDEYGFPILFWAIKKDYPHKIEMLEFLFQCGIDINQQTKYGSTLLHHFVGLNDRALTIFLLEKGASLDIKNQKNQTPIEALKEDIKTCHPTLINYKLQYLEFLNAYQEKKQLESFSNETHTNKAPKIKL